MGRAQLPTCEQSILRGLDSPAVMRSAQWAICSGICFSAALAVTVVSLLLGVGFFEAWLVLLLLLLMGTETALVSRRLRKLEGAVSRQEFDQQWIRLW